MAFSFYLEKESQRALKPVMILSRNSNLGLQDIINGLLGVSVAYGLSQALPPRTGHWLADRLGGALARVKSMGQMRALRANQWVVSGGQLSPVDLERIAHDTVRSTARCLYDYYHNMYKPEAILKLVRFDPAFKDCIQRSQEGRAGQLLVLPHFSNFDLVGRAAALEGMQFQVLSFPQPQSGYRWQNKLRSFHGMEITPIDIDTLRQASHRLRAGGTVATGVDRPVSDGKFRPVFFGRPAALPTGYIRLALSTGVPVVVISGISLPGGMYRVWASEPIGMIPCHDPDEEIVSNTERVLSVIEGLIRQSPRQWSMFYPVWPEALQEIPS